MKKFIVILALSFNISTILCQTLETPVLISPEDGGFILSEYTSYSWNSVPGATYYKLQVLDTSEASEDDTTGIFTLNTSYTLETPVAGCVCPYVYWRVRASNGIEWSQWSEIWYYFPLMELSCFPLLIYPPDNALVSTSFTFSWLPLLCSISSDLQVATNSDFSGNLTININTYYPCYHVSGLSCGTTYYWRVRAVGQVVGYWSDEPNEQPFAFTTVPDTQQINLQPGWTTLSSYINPNNSSIETILSDISNNFVIFKNGNGELYIPEYGIDLLHNWDINDGYQVYMTNPDTLTITGNIIAPENTPINLNTGWNLISYLRSSPMAIEQALSDILQQIIVVKDNYGGLYIPSMGINLIGNMQPGQGYQVYVSQDVVLTYPGD